MLGLGTSKNVSGISNSSLQQPCKGSFFSILLTFSAIKGPAKELRLSFMSGEKYVNKIFYYFQGLRALKCHRTKRSNRVNDRLRWLLQKTFSSSTPPSAWISSVFDPPSCENFQNPIHRGGVDFFWNNPFEGTETVSCRLELRMTRMEMDWNLKNLASFFKFWCCVFKKSSRNLLWLALSVKIHSTSWS